MLAALYIGLSLYYKDGFTYGTWVNAVYCTGKTVSQINDELIATDGYQKIVLVLPDGTERNIWMDEVAYHADFTESLQEIQGEQNPWKWYQNLSVEARNRSVVPNAGINEQKLKEVL